MKRIEKIISVAMVVFFLAIYPGTTAEKSSADRATTEWLSVYLNRNKIGYMTITRSVYKDKVITITRVRMNISRMGTTISAEDYTETVETIDGKPISFKFKNTGAGSDIFITGVVTGDGKMQITSQMAGRKEKQTLPWPNGALMPEGSRLLALQKGLAEGTAYTVDQFAPNTLSAATIDVTVGKKKKVKIHKTVKMLTLVTYNFRSQGGDLVIKSYLEDDQTLRKMTVPLMGMEMELISSSREQALSMKKSEDFFNSILVTAPRRVLSKELLKGISYRLKLKKNATFTLTDSTAEQDIFPLQNSSEFIIKVSPVNMPKGSPWGYKGNDESVISSLKPSAYIQSDASEIILASKKAVGGHKDPAIAARAIEHYVNSYITKKNLSVGYASALEVLKSREGDCSEHAVLTAALCRAAGIPARIVVGIVYTESYPQKPRVFIPHAWTQVYIEGSWYSLDAALGSFAAGHIALYYGNGDPLEFFSIIKLLGSMEIVEVKGLKR